MSALTEIMGEKGKYAMLVTNKTGNGESMYHNIVLLVQLATTTVVYNIEHVIPKSNLYALQIFAFDA